MNDIMKNDCFGKCVGITHSNKFQKHGLPHTHGIGYLSPESKLHTSEDIDSCKGNRNEQTQ